MKQFVIERSKDSNKFDRVSMSRNLVILVQL